MLFFFVKCDQNFGIIIYASCPSRLIFVSEFQSLSHVFVSIALLFLEKTSDFFYGLSPQRWQRPIIGATLQKTPKGKFRWMRWTIASFLFRLHNTIYAHRRFLLQKDEHFPKRVIRDLAKPRRRHLKQRQPKKLVYILLKAFATILIYEVRLLVSELLASWICKRNI